MKYLIIMLLLVGCSTSPEFKKVGECRSVMNERGYIIMQCRPMGHPVHIKER